MSALVPNSEFWDYALPQLLLAPLSVPVSDVLGCFEPGSGLLADVDYRDLSGWARCFASIDLWTNEDVDARCRALAATLIAEASPQARQQLFNLLELWAHAYAPDVAAQIEDHLRWRFDLEREVELEIVDALRVLASVCTLLGAEHMVHTGLAIVVDEDAPSSADAQLVIDRLLRRADLNSPRGLQVHDRVGDHGELIDPPKLTPTRPANSAALAIRIADGVAQFFAHYVGYLSDSQHLFVTEDLRPCLAPLLADAELHEVDCERSLTCCGGALYLLALPGRWIAIQSYAWC
ncbi:MAG TPA: hypothetical protein VM869_21535 [Enhygromyxa sp.]|nr:hypothetical protein [Enhygromyxa sp.]